MGQYLHYYFVGSLLFGCSIKKSGLQNILHCRRVACRVSSMNVRGSSSGFFNKQPGVFPGELHTHLTSAGY
jgi:hypothetical protein